MTLPEVKGFIDLSLVDWDDRVSAVLFLPRCNFRCPFCYNSKLVLEPENQPSIPFEEIKQYLARNRPWLDGVVITGGEPTIHSGLPALCKEIRELGFSVKLDTNGTNSKMIRKIMHQGLVNFFAVDIKAPLTAEKYSLATGVQMDALLFEIEETIDILLQGSVDYEFRTTLVPGIHEKAAIEKICRRIEGCRKFVLQNFKSDVEPIDVRLKDLRSFSAEQMNEFLSVAKKIIPGSFLR
jgi:pyruvate formate lyase activating enzyme